MGLSNAVSAIEVHPDFAIRIGTPPRAKAEPLPFALCPGINGLRECLKFCQCVGLTWRAWVRYVGTEADVGEMWWSCESGEQFRCWNLREPIAQLRRSSHLKNPDVTRGGLTNGFAVNEIDHARQYVGIGVGWDSVTKVEDVAGQPLRLSEYAQDTRRDC